MRFTYFLLLLLSAFTSVSCTEQVTNDQTTSNTEDTRMLYREFENSFKPIDLPYGVPSPGDISAKNLIKPEIITAFFVQRTFSPAFGEIKDVPDLAENIENSRFYAEGMLEGSDFNAYIIHKLNSGDYYYLCTLDSFGGYLDGMCIAFNEGNEGNITERIASVNEDRSIHIVQRELTAGEQRSELTGFYEVNADGKIVDLEMSAETPIF